MNIALLGFGVVGSGVYEWCRGCEDLHVRRVLVRSEKPQIADIATHDFEDILHDDSIDIVAEVMGGLHPAYEYVTAALKAGKHVVTANKALIAAYYQELTELAKAQGKALLCTAAVGGGIPWLVNLARCKKLDTICRVGGIMNGTSNFIMDAMHKSPVSFPAILKQAQELGYAEADPSADIDGDDIRRKLVISANIAFDALLREEDIPMFGIRTVTDGDIKTFQSRGFACKLLAEAAQAENGVCAYIEPTLVDAKALEAAVPANFNLITYEGENIGRQSFYGQGAPLLRPHQRTRRMAEGAHRRRVGRRRRHRRGKCLRDALLGQKAAGSRSRLLHRRYPVRNYFSSKENRIAMRYGSLFSFPCSFPKMPLPSGPACTPSLRQRGRRW